MLSLTVIVQKYLLLTGSLLATASTDILYLHRNGDMSLSFLSLVADISFQCWQSSIIKFRSVPFRKLSIVSSEISIQNSTSSDMSPSLTVDC